MKAPFVDWMRAGRWMVGCLAMGTWTVWAQSSDSIDRIDWTEANQNVAEFPRGHVDVLKWERSNPLTTGQREAPAVGNALSLMSSEAAIRQAWAAHRSLVTVINRVGAANANLIADSRGAEVDASLQRRVGDMAELLEVANQARKAWLHAVAARQVAQQQRTALEAAEAASELGLRMAKVGNWSRLQHAQVKLAESNARMNVRKADYASAQAEAALLQALRLTGQYATVKLPDRLPDVPTLPLSEAVLDERAQAIARQLPRMEAQRNAALVRMARQAYAASFTLAKASREELVQTRELISEETLLRYNGMLKSVWDVLAEASNQSQALVAAIESQRDFWLADADLQWVLQGGQPTSFVSLGAGSGGEFAGPAGH